MRNSQNNTHREKTYIFNILKNHKTKNRYIHLIILACTIGLISELIFGQKINRFLLLFGLIPLVGCIAPIIYLIKRRKEKMELNKLLNSL